MAVMVSRVRSGLPAAVVEQVLQAALALATTQEMVVTG
jgi:hypothetical protein